MINWPESYELILRERIEEIRADACLLHHRKSGAKLLLMDTPDDNKVFSVTFRTTPENSTGVPHIMEHSVLCGSEKYPLKDPFVELCKGSLNTFLNAMTWPDKTSYPVASRNTADFKNLMSVYMDAVFRPNIFQTENILKQEGWHYELDSADGELTYNGVVYNEMRGSFSDPDTMLENAMKKHLYPGTTYEVVSGGDPECIPSLGYPEFLEFHRRYYHPSNAYIYLYGDMDFKERLEWLDDAYLSGYDAIDPKTEVGMTPHFDRVKEIRTEYNVSAGEEEHNSVFLYAKAMDEIYDPVEVKAMEVLSYALLNAPGAPIKKALLEAKLGAEIYGGYDSGYRQPNFSVVAKGTDPENFGAFYELVDRMLRKTITDGIPKKTLLAGINNIEFSLREADYGAMPRGLVYNFIVSDTWLHDETKALVHLRYDETFRKLKELTDSDYFERLAERRILKNTFGIVLLMEARSGLSEEADRRTAERLAAYKATLSEKEIQKLVEDTKALKAYQDAEESEEALETIPLLKLSDVDEEPLKLPNEERSIQGVKVVYHDVATNGIAYLEARFSMEALSEEELFYAGLLRELYTELSTERHSYQALGDEISFETGGIGQETAVLEMAPEYTEFKADFGVTARYLYDRTDGTFRLLQEIYGHTLFTDTDRIREVLDGVISRQQETLHTRGHGTAVKLLFSQCRESAYTDECLSGLAFFRFLVQLKNHYEEARTTLPEKLKSVEKKIFTKDHLILSFTGEEAGYRLFEKASGSFISALEDRELPRAVRAIRLKSENLGIKTPSLVQYTAMGGDFRKYGYEYTGVFSVLATLMRYEYLWTNIRVKGGAYGCMTRFLQDGLIAFASYRDPHLKNTLDVFKKVPDYLETLELSDRDMTKYILGTVGEIDMPLQPQALGSRAFLQYLSGVTDDMRRKERREILNCKTEDLSALSALIRDVLRENHFVTVGSESKLEEERTRFDRVEYLQGDRE